MTETGAEVLQQITRRKRRRWKGWLVLALLVALCGGGAWVYGRGSDSTPAVSYTSSEVATRDIVVQITAVGTVEPIEQVDVSSLISGTIAEMAVRVNDRVKKGDVLARLDTSSLQAELARDQATLAAQKAQVADAEAALEAARATLARVQKIHDKGLNTDDELSTAATAARRAEAGLAQAMAQVQVAEANVLLSETSLAKAVITSPIDGMVLEVSADVGQTVNASASETAVLFTLAHDLAQMRLSVDVAEADVGKVALDNPAEFTVDAWLGESFPAQVSELHYAPQTVDGIVTYPTILSIDNSDLRLRPGMTASADITVQEVKGVLTVPNAAFRFSPPRQSVATQSSSGLLGVLFSGGGPGGNRGNRTTVSNEPDREGFRGLYVLRDGVPAKVQVKTGATDGTLTQVLEGDLKAGDLVVTAQTTVAE
ncbi:efflux RND transporter periplasmic adaptor subunit [Stagnihabitans tardus]|uniref:Efflux RND transporter periplasmic adaptor subunit n=1 Tax=Stagnihabitans tardus TaxID=2699202 RepID=A0AAE4Y970_9RHOB|nr:efflux RND transporter periplasmic adaptor subunit [Stagnihabitans tardus]NBZ87422.1 efflux RND transporter periplasmic adaptor subunit [Stagnihabitans tardus]